MRTRTVASRSLQLAALALVVLVAACGGKAGPTGAGGSSTSAPGSVTSAPGSTAGSGGGTGGQATGGPVTDLARLCDLLGPGDFSAIGIPGAGSPSMNTDGPGSAYCVYAGLSAGTGGIEFDVFVGDDADGTYSTVMNEVGGGLTATTVPGADKAAISAGASGQKDKPASIVVKRGKLVFTIGAPAGPGVEALLNALAVTVLARGAGLTG